MKKLAARARPHSSRALVTLLAVATACLATACGDPGETTSGRPSGSSGSSGSGGAAGEGGGGGGGGGAGGQGGQGGSGGVAECGAPGDCPGEDTECRTRTCENGKCGESYALSGTLVMAQVTGDCLAAACDGAGEVEEQKDDADVPDDGNPCSIESCNAGEPASDPAAAGTPCDAGSGVLCDGAGACVECLSGADCMSGVCGAGSCVAATCDDSIKNANETDVDCGGPDCGACGPNEGCAQDSDCVGGLCSQATCAPTCVDQVINQDETDVDCGGLMCDPCADGMGCAAGTDCSSGVCGAGVCAAATCGDGVVNGSDACDDGNADNTDACLTTCVAATCGDGFTRAGVEGCDDANADNTDACLSTCVAATCGDGFTRAGVEVCDDGNASNTDACLTTCVAATCGDGFTRAGVEGCDDGNASNTDACLTTCLPASCGDGFTWAGVEGCDDGNASNTDACLTTCAAASCGDGYVRAGVEACDDGDGDNTDGCLTTCAVASCGDGYLHAGVEACDDGNTTNADGCSATCVAATGESCLDPLAKLQATVVNGVSTWTIPASSVSQIDGDFACDASGSGPDAVIVYNKLSDGLATGGKLLHVSATTGGTTTANYLNLEIVGSGCAAGQAVNHTCLWYKHDWDSYLDLPAGTYYIWVAKNSTGAFPATTVSIEEIDAADAEGEGCFAPYTDQSSIYAPPGAPGAPHTWVLPATINAFDMGPEWGEPQSISCDNTTPYGDITGVDAVIEFNKVSATSILKVDVQNLDPVLTQSDLNVELLSVCDPLDPVKFSRNCRANADVISFTAPAPQGASYIWVSSEATGEEFNGAQVAVTEIFPGPGESWGTAVPLLGSGLIAPTSAMRLDAPSCFPATGNIHWYSYTIMNDAVRIGANAAGALGIIDGSGQPIACVTNAQVSPIGVVEPAGTTLYIAVESPSSIAGLSIDDIVYTGLKGDVTDLQVTFPTSAVADQSMAVGPSDLYLAGTSKVFAMPKAGNALATEYGTAQGITTTHLGYDIELAGGSLFSVDSTTTTNVSRLFRIFDGSVWAPTAWDLTPAYPAASPSHSLAFDGTGLFMATRHTTLKVDFYSFSTSAPGAPTHLGTNTSVAYVSGLAADDQYFYVAGLGLSQPGEGVFRIQRSNIAAQAVKLASIDAGTLNSHVDVDAYISPANLYVRDALGSIHAVSAPASGAPIHVGTISTLGTSSDYAMTFDHAAKKLYFFETESDSAGRIVVMK